MREGGRDRQTDREGEREDIGRENRKAVVRIVSKRSGESLKKC